MTGGPSTVRWGSRKPPLGVQLDRSHPLSRGLRGLWAMNEGAGLRAHNLVDGSPALALTPVWRPGGVSIASTDARVFAANPPAGMAGRDQWTAVVVASATSYAESAALSFRTGSSTADLLIVYPFDTNAGNGLRVFYRASNPIDENGASDADGRPKTFVVTMDGATMRGYVNGALRASGAATGGLAASPSNLDIGRWTPATQVFHGDIYLAGFYNRPLAASEAAWLYAEPYAMLQPIRRRFYSIPAGGVAAVLFRRTRGLRTGSRGVAA